MAGLDTIVIGTSLAEESDAAVRAGLALARAAGGRAHLVHAAAATLPLVPSGAWPIGFDVTTSPDTLAAVNEAQERQVEEGVAAQLGRLAVTEGDVAARLVRPGVPHRVLIEAARELDADLIVVGAHEARGLARLLGSTTDRVLRKAHRPVLVVRGELTMPPARVLASVDLSSLSAEAFRHGLDLLEALTAAGKGGVPTVEALFVLAYAQRQVAPQFTPEQIDRLAAEELDRFIDRHGGEIAARVQRKVRVGTPREQILAEVAEWQPDLVLLGTHGLGGFDRLVIGSVAADVARESPVSVLVIPPPSKSAEIREG